MPGRVKIVRIPIGVPVVLPVILLAVLAAAACTPARAPEPAADDAVEKPQYGGIAAIRNKSDPPSFDLHLESSFNVSQPAAPGFDNLVRFAPLEPDKIVGDLAERWETSPDGNSITFFLRKGVKFHDGSDFTAQDAKFSLDRVRGAITGAAAVASPRRGALAAISAIEAPDDFRLILRLSRPSASTVPALASGWQSMLSKAWVEQGHDPKKEINGTGPFKLKEYIRGTSVEFVRNEGYWAQGQPYLDGVKVFVIPDDGTALAAMRTGQLTTMNIEGSQEESLRPDLAAGKVKLTWVRPCCGTGTPFHLNATKKPLDDVRVRKALSLALDRASILKAQRAGEGSVVTGYLTQGGPWSLPPAELAKIPGYGSDKESDRAEARRLLAEAGYASGLSLKVLTRTEQDFVELGTIFVDQVAKVGIKAEMDLRDVSVVYDRVRKKDYEVASYGGIASGDDPDLIYSEFFLCKAARNYHGICNQQVEELFSRQSELLDQQERKKIVWDMERLALQDFGRLVTYAAANGWAVDARVQGWTPHPLRYNADRWDGGWLGR